MRTCSIRRPTKFVLENAKVGKAPAKKGGQEGRGRGGGEEARREEDHREGQNGRRREEAHGEKDR